MVNLEKSLKCSTRSRESWCNYQAISRETISVYTRSDLLVFLLWDKNNLSSVSFRSCGTASHPQLEFKSFAVFQTFVVRPRRRFHFLAACSLQTLKDVGRVRFIEMISIFDGSLSGNPMEQEYHKNRWNDSPSTSRQPKRAPTFSK